MKTSIEAACASGEAPIRDFQSARRSTSASARRRIENGPGSLCAVILLLLALLSTRASAQYSIDWFTIDGGGGTSTGGVFSVSGTIGQPDAGITMTGGQYAITGGFWALYALQTPGAPLLRIFRTTTNTVVVAWPSPSTGWTLQQNTNLATTNWVTPSEPVQDNATDRFIVVNPPVGNRFYRLAMP